MSSHERATDAELAKKVLQHMRTHYSVKEPVQFKKLEAELSLEPAQLMTAVNMLLAQQEVDLFSTAIAIRSEEQAQNLRALSVPEKRVLTVVRSHGVQGVWTRTIKSACGMQQNVLTRVLKTLEQRKIIKSFRPTQAKNKKMFIMADLEPLEELTGGPWYDDNGEFDSALRSVIFEAVQMRINASENQVASFDALVEGAGKVVKNIDGVKVRDMVQQAVNALMLAGVIERAPAPLSATFDDMRQKSKKRKTAADSAAASSATHITTPFYRNTPAATYNTLEYGINSFPCASCPLFDQCDADNPVVNPQKCELLTLHFQAEALTQEADEIEDLGSSRL